MFEIFPKVNFSKLCPYCETKLNIEGVQMPGMRTLARCCCAKCKKLFYADLPVGHGIKHSAMIDADNFNLFFNGLDWYPLLLKKTLLSKNSAYQMTVSIQLHKNRSKSLIILNCLDTYYGHSLLKLLNASHHLKENPECDLLVIVPAFMKWLVPKRVRNVVSVEIPLRQGFQWIEELDQLLEKLKKRYSKIYLSGAYSLPDEQNYNFEDYVKMKPFDLSALEVTHAIPQITFIYREDRLWLNSHKLQKIISLCESHWALNVVASAFHYKQVTQINRLYRQLKKKFKAMRFAVAGVGKSVGLHPEIQDYRYGKIDLKTEKILTNLYAKSWVIIGVHGSNMLIPSALAGVTLNILPNYKLRNIAEDLILSPCGPRRMTLFRYRILPANMKIKDLVEVTYSCIRHFHNFKSNTVTNVYLKK